ncbi:hypothetical protein AF335_25950, partial [Streptomyces eurocidicus]
MSDVAVGEWVVAVVSGARVSECQVTDEVAGASGVPGPAAEAAVAGGVEGVGVVVDAGLVEASGGYDYERFSRLTGPVREAPEGEYRVEYRRLRGRQGSRESGSEGEPGRLAVLRVGLLVGLAPLVSVGLLVWLLWPVH